MGCMVMGGLIVNYVNVHCGIVINASGTEFKLQESLFDAVLPNILPLTATLAIYGLMVYRHRTSIKVIFSIVAVGIIGGFSACSFNVKKFEAIKEIKKWTSKK